MKATETLHHKDYSVLRFIRDSHRLNLPAAWDCFCPAEQQAVLDMKELGLVESYRFDAMTTGHRPTAKGREELAAFEARARAAV